MKMFLPVIPSLNNIGSGKTLSLPNKSSINSGFLVFNSIFFETISSIEGTVRMGIFKILYSLKILFLLELEIDDIAKRILLILYLEFFKFFGDLIGILSSVLPTSKGESSTKKITFALPSVLIIEANFAPAVPAP